MPSLTERRRLISIAPLQISSSPMAEAIHSRKPIKKTSQKPSFSSFFSCKHHCSTAVVEAHETTNKKKANNHHHKKRIGWSGSLCNLKESSKVMQRPEPYSSSPELGPTPSSSSITHSSSSSSLLSTSSSSLGGSFRAMQLRRLSGCYECHMVVDPITGVSRVPSLRRPNVHTCSDCGDIFAKPESLELHQATKHAVSELGPEDNSRNIVEIIFTSSWLKKQTPLCKIDRILKIHHTPKTVMKFEAYRDSIKSKANMLAKKHPRCIADGNELLRFHCTTFACSLGLNGSKTLCSSLPGCRLCSILKDGFGPAKIRTMSTSGLAHDANAHATSSCKDRAMLVCRVIAGRVKRNQEEAQEQEFDSVAGNNFPGFYSNLDELFVFDPKAILPCFVIIYKCL